jgi:6-hydroxynicotinate reductase
MVDVALMPDKSFGSVPTPAIVSPIEFTMKRKDYLALGGHADSIRSVADAIKQAQYGIKPQIQPWNALNTWPQFPISDA